MLNLSCLFACNLQAQTTDFGAIVGAGYSGKIVKGFGYSVEGEIKTGGNFTEFLQSRHRATMPATGLICSATGKLKGAI